MPKKQLVRYRPRGAGVRTTGGGVRTTGGGLKRTGCGKKRGGSMRHLATIPQAVRNSHINKLNTIIKDAAKPGSSKTSAIQRIKNWAMGAHKVAQTYNLYSKGATVGRLGYNLYRARYGKKPLSLDYSSVQSVD